MIKNYHLFRIFDLRFVIIFRCCYDILSFFIFKRMNKRNVKIQFWNIIKNVTSIINKIIEAMYAYNNAWHNIVKINFYQIMFKTKNNWAKFLKKRENFEISAVRFRVQMIINLRNYLYNRLKKRKLHKLNIIMQNTYSYFSI